MPEPTETTYQLVRGVALAAAFALALALERWRPHERMRRAWLTNLGLWALDSAVMAIVCGAYVEEYENQIPKG